MARHTTFRFCLDATVEQQAVLVRHAGASRFAYNQCLQMVKTALTQHRIDPDSKVPWTKFDLINTFNAWKTTGSAGRLFAVDREGVAEETVTGLSWRGDVCQQVFEEAAVDCARALAAWSDSRSGKRTGRRVGFPRFKKKGGGTRGFRLRNKQAKGRKSAIQVGKTHPRSVTLPGIGTIRVHDDTRRLRRMLAKDRAKILSATVSYSAGRWWISLTAEAADLHSAQRHPARADGDHSGWAGVDRGLSAFLVAATSDGCEVARVDNAPKALANGMRNQRRLAKSLSRKKKGSNRYNRAAVRLARHHKRVRNIRRHFLHAVSNELVKTHDRIVLEDLNVAGMLANRRLARAISDAGWAEFARQLRYKADWRGGEIATADRWYPSSQTCSQCHERTQGLTLADRVFTCSCGHSADRDLNAAVNLARWGEYPDLHRNLRTRKHAGRVTNARRREGSDRRPMCVGETTPNDAGTDVHAVPAA
jgi:putative transposase